MEAIAIRSKVYALKIKRKDDVDEIDREKEHLKNKDEMMRQEEKEYETDTQDNDTDSEEDSHDSNCEIVKRMKGVRKPIVKERVTIEDYRKTLY